MGVMVYSQLGAVLRTQRLTVDDLQRQISVRFGMAVDSRTLDRLARDQRLRRPNIEIVRQRQRRLAWASPILSASTPDPSTAVERSADEEVDVLAPEQSQPSVTSSTRGVAAPRPMTSEPSWTRLWARGVGE